MEAEQLSKSSVEPENNEKKVESRYLPTFENWVNEQLKDKDDYNERIIHIKWFACVTTLQEHALRCREICHKYNGLMKQDDKEFEQHQMEWWYHYMQISAWRNIMLISQRVRAPVWDTEIMQERDYLGVLLSKEDFEKFLLKDGSPFHRTKVETPATYEQDLKQKAAEKRQAALAKAAVGMSKEETIQEEEPEEESEGQERAHGVSYDTDDEADPDRTLDYTSY